MTACSSKNKGDSSWGLHRGDDKGEFVEDGQTKSVRVATLLSNESLAASEEICDVKKCIERQHKRAKSRGICLTCYMISTNKINKRLTRCFNYVMPLWSAVDYLFHRQLSVRQKA